MDSVRYDSLRTGWSASHTPVQGRSVLGWYNDVVTVSLHVVSTPGEVPSQCLCPTRESNRIDVESSSISWVLFRNPFVPSSRASGGSAMDEQFVDDKRSGTWSVILMLFVLSVPGPTVPRIQAHEPRGGERGGGRGDTGQVSGRR